MFIYNWVGIDTALVGNLNDSLIQHAGLLNGRAANRVWRMFWFAIIWSIWLHRDELIFKDHSLDFCKVTDLIKVRVWSWCKAFFKMDCFSFNDWCINLVLCIKSVR